MKVKSETCMKSLYEELGGTYRQVGDYFIPDIELPERNYQIGKYGRMCQRYLKEYRKIQYTTMILNGMLYDHLEEIDRICNERIETMVAAMKKQQGITEELKARDQLAWVGAMNNIRSCAEEIILRELVYEEDGA